MTALGKSVRLNRIFSHPSGRILTVAVDHLITYPTDMPEGLRDLGRTIDQIVQGKPNAITMNKGAAIRFMPKHAGAIPFIVQQMALRPESPTFADHATVDEVVALGADAIAVAMFLKGDHEMAYIRHLAHVVREAESYGLPVIPHIYPLTSGDDKHAIAHKPEDIFYCVRMGLEMGVDLIKVPYTGDVESYKDIVSLCPVPIVAAGGPACPTLEDAVRMVKEIVDSGASGATMGRNIWSFPDIPESIETLKDAMYASAVSRRFAVQEAKHLTTEELEQGLDEIRQSPKDDGVLDLIVRRPAEDEREILQEGQLDVQKGLLGDTWPTRKCSRTPDGSAHPDMQLNIMGSRAIALISQHNERWQLAGDQLFLDMDLSKENLPAGTRLAIGDAIVEVTSQPHLGCKKFVARFGKDAMKFVNSTTGKQLCLRGINAKVIQPGTIRTGDLAKKL